MHLASNLSTVAPASLPLGQMEVSFSLGNKKELEYAKSLYQQARLSKRQVVVNGKDAESFRDCAGGSFLIEAEGHRDLGQCALHLFDETGDRRIMWRPDRPDEVKDAAKLFKEYLSKGWKAYAIHRADPNKKGVRIYEFEPELDEVVFDDRTIAEKLSGFATVLDMQNVKKTAETAKTTVKEKLKKFVERFDEIKVLPKTYPG